MPVGRHCLVRVGVTGVIAKELQELTNCAGLLGSQARVPRQAQGFDNGIKVPNQRIGGH